MSIHINIPRYFALICKGNLETVFLDHMEGRKETVSARVQCSLVRQILLKNST